MFDIAIYPKPQRYFFPVEKPDIAFGNYSFYFIRKVFAI